MHLLLLIAFACSSGSTQGEACRVLGAESCDKLLVCNLTFTEAELCADQVVGACCEDDGTCDDSAEAAVLQCSVDFSTATCEEIEESPPASCAGLL